MRGDVDRSTNMKRALLPLVIIVAITAIAIPACQMVGCTMPPGSMFMRIVHHGPLASLTGRCPGEVVTHQGPLALTPSGSDASLLSFIAAGIGVAVVLSKGGMPRALRVIAALAPRPPNDPLQGRLRI